MTKPISARERVALLLILFALKILEPTGYGHQVDELRDEIKKALKADD